MHDHARPGGRSDIELEKRVRSGDFNAAASLLSRHREAVARLNRAGAGAPEESAWDVVAWSLNGGRRGPPFRAAWLAMHVHGTVPPALPGDRVWAAYLSLPASWQLAVWHGEIEGETHPEIAERLGLDECTVAHVLASAYAAMRRRMAFAHRLRAPTSTCLTLVNAFRVAPPVALDRRQADGLEEHGRSCGDCEELVRDLLMLEHGLARALAGHLLGDAAEGYVAGRGEPVRATELRRSPA